jgi:hypothetical protein
MIGKAVLMVAVIGMVPHVTAQDQMILARFDGAIGVDPVANVAGPVNVDTTFPNVKQNVVRGVVPAGPWRIAGLKANIYTDGHIIVDGRGLVLAAGNSIGQTANQSVFATLICDATIPFVEHSTTAAGVRLEPNGDFRIDDTLNPVPSDCASPVLLIRAASNGTWFAAGILKLTGSDQ